MMGECFYKMGKTPQALEQYNGYLHARSQVIALIGQAREDLAALYRQDLSDENKRSAKQLRFDRLKQDYQALSAQFGSKDGFRYW